MLKSIAAGGSEGVPLSPPPCEGYVAAENYRLKTIAMGTLDVMDHKITISLSSPNLLP